MYFVLSNTLFIFLIITQMFQVVDDSTEDSFDVLSSCLGNMAGS